MADEVTREGVAARLRELYERAAREPLEIDVSDYSDEWVAGFLIGQQNVIALLLREAVDGE